MIRTWSIGDTHGRRIWSMIKGYSADKIIFVGDYCDSFDVSSTMILHELKRIIEFKKDNMDKVILLWGNHDIQYYLAMGPLDRKYRCSGYRPEMYFDLYDLFRKNRHLFQMAFQIKNNIWTHAGLSKGWFNFRFLKHWDKENETIADALNRLFEEEHPIIFDVGRDRGGSSPVGGPLWVDKNTLYRKPIEQVNQIVGHTAVSDIKTYTTKAGTNLAFIDCLEYGSKRFYKLDIEE